MRFTSYTLLLLLLAPCLVTAQEAVLTGGGDASSANGSVSFSVGQVVYEFYEAGDGSSAEGVQHPYELFVITSSGDELTSYLTVKAYPNPVADWVEVQLENFSESDELHYQLYGLNGQILMQDQITSNRTIINLQPLAAGTYLLKVHGMMDRSFRLVKIN